MKKTIIATAIILGGTISFYACGTDKVSSTAEETTITKEAPDSVGQSETKVSTAVSEPDTTSTKKEGPKESTAVKKEKIKEEISTSASLGKESPSPTPAVNKEKDNTAEIEEGKVLISNSDCFACHKLQEKLVGPSYSDVAKKYTASEQTIEQLANKVKDGGAGVWGQVPMSPHPSLSKSDAKKMITYILSIKP